MKSLLKVAFVSIFVFAMAGMVAAQVVPATPTTKTSLPNFNPPPCDFSDQFYGDNGIDSSQGAELNTEPDGRFGSFRQTGPPAPSGVNNWVVDTANCSSLDPTRRDIRILATTGGNSDDGNSPFSCADQGGAFAVPTCPPPNGTGQMPDTAEYISILAFLHKEAAFESTYLRDVGFINGGLQGVQQNPGTDISIGKTLTIAGQTVTEPATENLRGISMEFIVSNFEAYAAQKQVLPNGHFATRPCSLAMIQQFFPNETTVPADCFPVNDTTVNGHTLSNVATPNLRQDWRFATNRNAMDGSDNNCINTAIDPATGVPFCAQNGAAGDASFSDSPFGYFCDDLLGMWVITYFYMTTPPTDKECGPVYQSLGNANGFNLDGTPIVLTAHELNDILEGHVEADGVTPFPCGAEAKEDVAGGDHGAVWLVCPALQDPRNGAIAADAFLDVVKNSSNNALDMNVFNQFACLQKKGKFCFESNPGQ